MGKGFNTYISFIVSAQIKLASKLLRNFNLILDK